MLIKSITRTSKTDTSLARWFPGWLEERYGNHYAQMSVDTTLRVKSACKDVSRMVRKFVPDDIEELTKRFMLPPMGITDYNFVMGYHTDEGYVHGSSEPGHTGTDKALLEYISKYPKDWETVKKAIGLTRQKSKHASAFLVANQPIDTFIPLTSVGGTKVTAYTADTIEKLGGIKMDWLVINVLNDIQSAVQLIQGFNKPEARTINGKMVPSHHLVMDPVSRQLADIWDLPEDEAVFDSVAAGKTETVFQFSTHGAMKWLHYFNYKKPDETGIINSILSMAIFTALDRPGPLDYQVPNPDYNGPEGGPGSTHNILVEYSRRARGAHESLGVLPVLKDLVPETLGLICFQESLQRVYQTLTDCSGPEAEEFRGDVAKKRKEKVDKAYLPFLEQAGNKIGRENAEMVFRSLQTFGQYGFNKSHAVGYAMIAYACAWLKFYYPTQWWCSVLKNASKDDINEKFWRYCSNMIDLPDIKKSQHDWSIDGDKLRAPISLLHGIGQKAHEQLCRYMPYTSIEDFCQKIYSHKVNNAYKKPDKTGKEKTYLGRCAISRSVVYKLAVSGVMDSLFPPDSTVSDCMAIFDKSMKAVDKKYKADVKYLPLDPIGRYQVTKSCLPAYGFDLREYVSVNPPDYIKFENSKLRYLSKRYNQFERRMLECSDPVISSEKLETLNVGSLPQGGYRCAAIAYIEDKKLFRYGEGKRKEALELTLEVGGGRFNFATWPDDSGELSKETKSLGKGDIIAVLLTRTRDDKPFSIKEYKLIRPAIQTTKEDDDDGTNDSKS